MRLGKERLLRWWIYFRRGHATYLVFFLSFANFIVIQYRLLVEYVPALSLFFTSLLSFAIAFFLVYIPLAVAIGWYDYKRFAVPVESTVGARASPYNRDLALALKLIAEGKNKEAVKILEKWTKEL